MNFKRYRKHPKSLFSIFLCLIIFLTTTQNIITVKSNKSKWDGVIYPVDDFLLPDIQNEVLLGRSVPVNVMWLNGGANNNRYDFRPYGTQIPPPFRGYFGQFEYLLSTGQPLYCVEWGKPAGNNGAGHNRVTDFSQLSEFKRDRLKEALLYGFNGTPIHGGHWQSEYKATQAIIWLIVQDQFNAGQEQMLIDIILNTDTHAKNVYNYIKSKISTHTIIPSFADYNSNTAPNYDMHWVVEGGVGRYRAILTDTNNVIGEFLGSLVPALNAQGFMTRIENGNQLIIDSVDIKNGNIIQSHKNLTENTPNLVFYQPAVAANQWKVGTDGLSDPVRSFFSLRTRNIGNLNIIKTSEDGVVAGLRFNVTNNVDYNQVHTTDVRGNINISSVKTGLYTVTEVNTPDRYVQPQSQTLMVNHNATTTFRFNNVIKKGRAELTKTDDISSNRLRGAVFGLYRTDTNVKINEYTTNNNGTFMTHIYNYGERLYLKEIKAPNGYTLNANQYHFTVTSHNQVIPIVVRNKKQMGRINIAKVDDDSNISLSGAEYDIIAKEDIITPDGVLQYRKDDIVDSVTTSASGNILSSPLFLGKYKIVERKAPNGYVLDTTVFDLEIIYSAQTVDIVTMPIVVRNKKQVGQIIIDLWGEKLVDWQKPMTRAFTTSDIYKPVYQLDKLQGGIYEVIAKEDIITPDGITQHRKGSIVETLTTDIKGNIISSPLFLGKYKVVQTIAPVGYFLSAIEFEIELSFTTQNEEVNFVYLKNENIRQKTKTSTFKSIEENEIYPNKEIYKDIKFGVFNVNQTLNLKENSLVDIIYIDDILEGYSNTDFPFGEYYIKEIETHESLILNENQYNFTFRPLPQTIPFIFIDINNGTPIHNPLKRGKIEINKTSDLPTEILEQGYVNKSLEGAKFTIYKKTNDVKLEEVEVLITDKKGFTESSLLPYGEYILRETKAPDGYILLNEEHSFNINENDTIIKFDIKNKVIKANVIINKKDESGKFLDGAVFGLYTKENLLINEVATQYGVAIINNVVYGDYYIKELVAPNGYLKSSDKYYFSVGDEEQNIEINIINNKIILPNEKPPYTGTDSNLFIFFIIFIISVLLLSLKLIKKHKN
ncbi:MAG: SpaA isopeptide-forming pilin-related protein [Oscillospiraceae bacterium]